MKPAGIRGVPPTLGTLAIALALCAATFLSCAVQARAEDRVNIAVAAINVAHAPIALAGAEPGIFGNHGITVNLSDLRGASPNCIAALLSKAVELCQVGTTTGTDAIAEGADLVVVAVLTGPIAEIVLSSKVAAGLPVRADAPISERIRALKGLNIVTSAPGSANYILLDTMMATVGLSISDVRYRTLAEAPAMIEAIRRQQIDGAFWVIGSLANLIVEGSGVRWISLARGDVEDYQGLPFVSVFARRDWAEKNAELVRRIHASYADAIKLLKDQPEQSSKVIKEKYFPDLDLALWNDGYEQARLAFLDGAKVGTKSRQRSLDLQARSSGKDYGPAAFDKVVIAEARAD